jgi:hypothetical protein
MRQKKLHPEGQVRVVLNPKYKPKAEEVLAATGLDNFSQLFSVLLVNYGDRLIAAFKAEQSLVVTPMQKSTEVINSDSVISLGGYK